MPTRALDRGLHIGRRVDDAFIELELEGDVGRTLRARAGGKRQSRNLRELFLERRGDRVRHRFRIRSGIAGGDRDDGIIDGRQIVYRELLESHDAKDN